MAHLNLLIAFAAGVLGFFSPCVVPLIPGYLSFVSGVSLAEMEQADRHRHFGRILGATTLFVLGFSLIFTSLGASASLVGGFVLSNRELLSRIGGAIVILLGLVMLGAVPIPGLFRERRVQITQRPTGWAGILLVGMAFGFAWIPCVGPILGAILTLAATTQRAGDGATLLFVYALGLGLPFLGTALLLTTGFRMLRSVSRYLRTIQVVSGAFLVVMGASLLFDWVYRLDGWILQVFPFRPAL
ncbi:MAG TPA: cytochrome c biogenesis protein CcdA [bacterium]|nr:cytochrome c biogenesis protein CcdA [bacterium]